MAKRIATAAAVERPFLSIRRFAQWETCAIFGSLQNPDFILGPKKLIFCFFGAIFGGFSKFGAKFFTHF